MRGRIFHHAAEFTYCSGRKVLLVVGNTEFPLLVFATNDGSYDDLSMNKFLN
jgi:hypothetical protein